MCKCSENPKMAQFSGDLKWNGGSFECANNPALKAENCSNLNNVILNLYKNLCLREDYTEFKQLALPEPSTDTDIGVSVKSIVDLKDAGIYEIGLVCTAVLTDNAILEVECHVNGTSIGTIVDRYVELPNNSGQAFVPFTYLKKNITLNVGDEIKLVAKQSNNDVTITNGAFYLKQTKPL